MAGDRRTDKRRVEIALFAQHRILAKRRGELAAWPNVPSSLVEALRDELESLPPLTSPPQLRKCEKVERAAILRGATHYCYRLGHTIALSQRRFTAEAEADALARIAATLDKRDRYLNVLAPFTALTKRRIDEAFRAGLKDGLQARVRIEEAAVELSKSLGGRVTTPPLKRLLASDRKFISSLRNVRAEDRPRIVRAFHERYGTTVSETINRCFPGPKARAATRALAQEGVPDITFSSWAERFDRPFLPGRRRKLLLASSEELQALDRKRRETGQPELAVFIRNRVREAGIRDLLLARLANDQERALSAELQCGLNGMTEFWPGRYFAGESAARRSQLLARFNETYPNLDFRTEVCRRMSIRERPLMFALIDHGVITPAELCYISIAGIGTDERTLVALFSSLTRAEIDQIERDFPKIWLMKAPPIERPFPQWFGILRSRLRIECGGDTWLDINCFLDQEQLSSISDLSPTSVDDQRRRQRIVDRTFEHERSGRAFRTLSAFSLETRCMDEDCSAVRSLDLESAASDESRAVRNAALLAFAESSCKICRELKHFVGNLATNLIAAVTVFFSLIALSLLGLPLLSVMIVIALVSGATRISLKGALKGKGYHREELVADLLYGLLDGITLFASRFLRQLALRSGTTFATKVGLSAGAKRYTTTLNLPGLARSGFDVRRLIGKKVRSESVAFLRLTTSLPPDHWLDL